MVVGVQQGAVDVEEHGVRGVRGGVGHARHGVPSPETNLEWYGVSRGASSYGLRSSSPRQAALIANPGCYATAAMLALGPLAGAIDPASVVVDAKSGVSGAGRSPKACSHAGFVLENLSPYAVGAHRHAPEIAQQLGLPGLLRAPSAARAAWAAGDLLRASDDDVRALLEAAYAASPVVRVLPEGTRRSSRACRARTPPRSPLFEDRATGTAIVICALDNLGKGAAGQAVQNANLALGLDETAGLRLRGAGVSVTAPQGFVAVRRPRRDPARRADLALVRSTDARGRRGDVHAQPRAGGAGRVSQAHLELAEPQAVVINSGVANAATGERGELDALATAAEAGAAARARRRAGARPLDRRDRRPAPARQVARRPRVAAARRSPRDGGADAAAAIMTTDTKPKRAAAGGPGFAVGGMAKGAGMIHPDLATMLAVVTTDYPLEPGEAIDFLRPAVDESFNSISVDGDCSTNDAVVLLANGAGGSSGRRRRTTPSRPRCAKVCARPRRQIVADGEGVDRARRDRRHRRRDDRQAKAIARRIATSPLVKTALVRPRRRTGAACSLAAGSAPYNGGYAQLDPARVYALLQRHGRARRAARRTASSRTSRAATCTIELDLGLGERPRRLPDERPLLRLRPHQRGVPHVSRSSSRSAARSPTRRAEPILALARGPRRRASCTARARRSPREMERRGLPVEFVGGRRVTTPAGLEVVRESLAAVNAALCAAIGAARGPLFGDEIGLSRRRSRRSGSSATRSRAGRRRSSTALAAGRIPVVAPLAAGPAERERRRGRGRARGRARRRADRSS